jgi:serine/threonine protein kinase
VKLERLYFYEECIEEGQYTRAQRAKFRTGNSVIDVLAKTLIQTEQEYVKNFRDNAKSLITLQHPNIINTIAIAYDVNFQTYSNINNVHFIQPNGPLVAIMEYFPGRTLLNHLHQNNADISWPVRLRIAVECAQALEYLHGNEVVYRQVTANHVILNDDFTVHFVHISAFNFSLISSVQTGRFRSGTH